MRELRRPFDLEKGPLFRAVLLRLAEEKHTFVLVVHHIVSDGWSMGVLDREPAEFYAAAGAGRTPDLPALEVQYTVYSCFRPLSDPRPRRPISAGPPLPEAD